MRVTTRRPLAALAAALALACGEGPDLAFPRPPPLARPVRASAESPFPPGCSGPGRGGVRFAGSQVEPSLAVNPANPGHLVASWQQDRWSNSGADGLVAAVSLDGGASWTAAPLPVSLCGGGAGRGGDFERATDPWVAISADGAVVHEIALAFSGTRFARKAILATRSTDGGLTWGDPVALAADDDPAFGLDKPSLTADPVHAGRLYAVWDRLTGLDGPAAASTGPAWLARSSDGGLSWEPPRVIHDPGPDAQTISSQIVVLPDGALVDVFVRITAASAAEPVFDVVAIRSTDGGETWTEPATVAALRAVGAVDPKSRRPVRAGEVVPSTAVDPASGALHVVWQDARFSGGARDGVALATSWDGGLTWSGPTQVNRAPGAQAFRPAVAVGAGGTLAVTYYDLRHDVAIDAEHVWTTFWKVTSADGGASWIEVPEGGPFDLRAAPDAGGLFLGDYTGLVAAGDGFVAAFSMAPPDGGAVGVFASALSGGAAPAGAPPREPTMAREARAHRGAVR